MDPTIQLKQSVVCPKEHPTKREINTFLSVGVLFGLMRLLFAGANDGVPNFGNMPLSGHSPTAMPASTPCRSVWMERAPVPYAAGGIFAVYDDDNGFVYAGGGTDLANSIVYNDLWQYDPANDSWTTLAPSVDPHALSQAVYFNGKIYNIGGYNAGFFATDTTRIYDIATNTWTTGAPMPQALTQMATALWNGVGYLAGENTTLGQVVDTLYAYNIASDTWTTLAPIPHVLTLPGFAAINGKLYIAGGFGGVGIRNSLYIYDIGSNTWTAGANLPEHVDGPGTSVIDGLLYVCGGSGGTRMVTNMSWIYDPATNIWSEGPNLPAAKYAMYGTAVGSDSIAAPGGLDANLVGISDNQQLITMPCPTPRPRPTPHARPTP